MYELDLFMYECEVEMKRLDIEHEANLERIESEFICERGG